VGPSSLVPLEITVHYPSPSQHLAGEHPADGEPRATHGKSILRIT